MSVLAQPSGGWFQNDMMQQVTSPKGRATVMAAIAFASLAGTGGVTNSHFWLSRQSRGYSVIYFQGESYEAAPASRTPTQNLARIRDVLKPAVSELATLFSVTRQTIYNWQGDEEPKPEHAAKLEDLAKATDIIALEGLKHTSQLLKRKISNGQNLLDIVRAGGSASDAAQKLVHIARREEQQRKVLAARLAGRNRPTTSNADLGVPMLQQG